MEEEGRKEKAEGCSTEEEGKEELDTWGGQVNLRDTVSAKVICLLLHQILFLSCRGNSF
jgi:hypothetical protein